MYQRQKKNARYYIIKHFVYLFIFCCIIWFLPSRPQAATNVTRKTMYIGDSYTLKSNGKIRDREEKIPLCHHRSYSGTGDHSQ